MVSEAVGYGTVSQPGLQSLTVGDVAVSPDTSRNGWAGDAG